MASVAGKGPNVVEPSDVPSVDALDAARRARNTRWISDGYVVAVAVLGLVAVVQGEPSLVLANVGAAFALYMGCSLMARRGRVQLAAAVLVTVPIVGAILTVVGEGRLGASPYFMVVSLIVSAAMQRVQGVLIALAMTFVGLALMAMVTRGIPLESETHERILTASSAILGVVGAVSALVTVSMRAALADSVLREQRAQLAEARAVESETRYRVISDNTYDLIGMLDERDRWAYTSPSFERILGIPAETLVGSSAQPFLADEATARLLAEAKTTGRATGLLRLRHAGGAWRELDTMVHAVESDGRRYMLATARDVTQERSLAAQLQQAQKMEALGRLAGGVAHDFNNLLMIIQSCAQLALQELGPSHAARRDLDDVLKASARAAALTKQLLAFSRRQVLPSSRVDMNVALADALGLAERLVADHVRIEKDLQEDLWPVTCGASQIEQIMLNLASNARDAMPDGGTLRVVARNLVVEDGAKPGEFVQLVVTDAGQGIDDDVRARIFEPFFTTKGPGVGTGLGLATCYGIVEQLGGSIHVDSELGVGTTFTILLPRSSASPTTLAPRPSLPGGDGKGVILVVDDDPLVLDLMRRVVVARGHVAVCAGSEEDGLARAKELGAKLNVVVSDVVLGDGGDGLRMVEAIRRAGSRAGVILTSGFPLDPAAITRSLEESHFAFLPKPFAPSELSTAIDAALTARAGRPGA